MLSLQGLGFRIVLGSDFSVYGVLVGFHGRALTKLNSLLEYVSLYLSRGNLWNSFQTGQASLCQWFLMLS